MKRILIDQAGELRCPECKGKNFDLSRTFKAKLGGWVTLGLGVFLMPKRMKCLSCGTKSKAGNAKKYSDPAIWAGLGDGVTTTAGPLEIKPEHRYAPPKPPHPAA